MFKLIIDNREKNVIRHADILARVAYTREQLTVGDYVVTYTGLDGIEKIFAVIERKSLEDYAASFKDGRSDNKNKLLQLRDATKCKIFYIIEGNAYPRPNETFGRIPYYHIQSSIFHLQVEHDIMIIQTKDTLHTAETLVAFMRSMENLEAKRDGVFKELIAPGGIVVEGGVDVNTDNNTPILDILTAPRKQTDNEILRSMWACFKYISVESACEFMYKFTIADLVRGKITRDMLKTQKTSLGKNISERIIDSLLKYDSHRDIRLLSCIPGISDSTAKDMIKQYSLRTILSYSEGAMSIIKVGVNRRNLGEIKASNILKYFNMLPRVENTERVENAATEDVIKDNEITIDEAIAMNVMANLDNKPAVALVDLAAKPTAKPTRKPTTKPTTKRTKKLPPVNQGAVFSDDII